MQKAYRNAASGQSLIFTPLLKGDSAEHDESVAAYKEGGESYQKAWLENFGFSSMKEMAGALKEASGKSDAKFSRLKDPAVKKTVEDLSGGLKKAQCDIDHIVEKQLGGTSVPSNLQLLTSSKNQEPGRETYRKLVELVHEIRRSPLWDLGVRKLQIRIAEVAVPPGASDAGSEIEGVLRSGAVRGSRQPEGGGKPIFLFAGGQGEKVPVRESGETTLGILVRRVVPGMRLKTYTRSGAGGASARDRVSAELDGRAMKAIGADSQEGGEKGSRGNSLISLEAHLVTPKTDSNGFSLAETIASGGLSNTEVRRLKLAPGNKNIKFYYPYLSPGELTEIGLDERGGLRGEGFIYSSVPFLGRLAVVYAEDELKLAVPLTADRLVSPLPAVFRFTGGELALQLSPTPAPSGRLTFEVGPAARPVLSGSLGVTVRSGALVATGKLVPAGRLPGVGAAAGLVTWNSETGWSGKITAETTSLPASTADVELGFTTAAGGFAPYARGGITTTVRGSRLVLGAAWNGESVTYTGSAAVEKPLPLVDSVNLSGRYDEQGLFLQGEAEVGYQQFKGAMKVEYRRGGKEEKGRFSGAAALSVRTEKVDGSLTLDFDGKGGFQGKGSIGYQITKDLRPVLGIEITEDQRIRLSGEVAVGDIVLVHMWPSPQGGSIPLLKGVGAKFSFPTPVPAVTAYLEPRGSLHLNYGVGPVMLKAVVFTGELYPFEEDPRITAKLTGAFAVPAYAELSGTFGAFIGAEAALGAIGAKGGIDISPSLRIDGEGGAQLAADYGKGGFSFSAEAYARGRLTARVRVLLAAEVYAAWGALSHRWTHEVADGSVTLGPELELVLGRIAYTEDGQIIWPDPSRIGVEPSSIDAVQVIKSMLAQAKGTAPPASGSPAPHPDAPRPSPGEAATGR